MTAEWTEFNGVIVSGGVFYHPRRPVRVVVIEGVSDGADVVARDALADIFRLAGGGVIGSVVFFFEHGDGKGLKHGMGGHHDIERFALRCHLFEGAEVKHHAVASVGEGGEVGDAIIDDK